jgi:transposase
MVLFWCMLTRGEDYAHQRPALTKKKQRQLELTAGAPARTKAAAGVWSTNRAILHAERALAEQAAADRPRRLAPLPRSTLRAA